MDEQMIAIVAAVAMTTNKLTDQELAAIYNVASAGWDPRGIDGYKKVRSLFTEYKGTRVLPMTLEALGMIVQERLGKGA